MLDFVPFSEAVHKQLTHMCKSELFYVDVDKNDLWDLYLASFPEGSNPQYKERTEHDCQCCKQFIRNVGNVVSIENGQLVSIWDNNLDNEYGVVAKALSDYVKKLSIKNRFLSAEKHIGNQFTHQATDDGIIKWDHLHFKLPNKFVVPLSDLIGTKQSSSLSDKEVFKRSLDEISLDAIEVVSELIAQNTLPRGAEQKKTVSQFLQCKNEYELIPEESKDLYCWETSLKLGQYARFRNTVIGTLIDDLSNDVDINIAVDKYGNKVDPSNYKRPKSLVTKKQIVDAEAKAIELGIVDSLPRRYANIDDMTINNKLFVDRDTKVKMNVFDEMKANVPDNVSKLAKVEEVSIANFIKDILPNAETIEVMFENKNVNNLMSLVAPINLDAKPILKWDNNFSWSYKGEVTDSMKQRVKNAGGNIVADLRFSIQWNEERDNQDDLDAHCKEPNKNLISYPKKGRIQTSSGMLDVDIVNPGSKTAVENITWTNKCKMPVGNYQMIVHCYSKSSGASGFDAQIEFDGNIHEFHYPQALTHNQKVKVADVHWDGSKFTLKNHLPSEASTKEVWGINTNKFHKVSMVMNSPNFWDGQKIGNQHFFFILENCVNKESARGFYNEFLIDSLHDVRKVFEVLGSKMKVAPSNEQLSGIGFSVSQRNSILCKVTGAFARTIKIIF